MTRAVAMEKIRVLKPQLAGLGVKSVSIFGSVLRDEASEASDIDLVAEFEQPHTFRQYIDALLLLEENLGLRVDLAEPGTLHPKIRDRVLREALRVA